MCILLPHLKPFVEDLQCLVFLLVLDKRLTNERESKNSILSRELMKRYTLILFCERRIESWKLFFTHDLEVCSYHAFVLFFKTFLLSHPSHSVGQKC